MPLDLAPSQCNLPGRALSREERMFPRWSIIEPRQQSVKVVWRNMDGVNLQEVARAGSHPPCLPRAKPRGGLPMGTAGSRTIELWWQAGCGILTCYSFYGILCCRWFPGWRANPGSASRRANHLERLCSSPVQCCRTRIGRPSRIRNLASKYRSPLPLGSSPWVWLGCLPSRWAAVRRKELPDHCSGI